MTNTNKLNVQNWGGPIQDNFFIEGFAAGEIAATVVESEADATPTLSRQDIVAFFDLKENLFTEAAFDNLGFNIKYESDLDFSFRGHFWLREGFSGYAQSKKFVSLDEVSPRMKCELEQMGGAFAENSYNLELGLATIADANIKDVEKDPYFFLSLYSFGLVPPSFGEVFSDYRTKVMAALVLANRLAGDVDRERSAYLSDFLKSYSATPEMMTRCAETLKYQDDAHLAHCIALSRVLENIFAPQKGRTEMTQYEDGTMIKLNTETAAGRMAFLEYGFNELKTRFPDVMPQNVQRILIVGPGLEQINQIIGEQVPQTTFEPFSVVANALKHCGADPFTLGVDLVDINPRVVKHLQRIVERANEGTPYNLNFLSPEFLLGINVDDLKTFLETPGIQRSSAVFGQLNGERVTIPPAIVKLLNPMEGNVITDEIAPAGSYDLVVMLNVFQYLNPVEQRLAIDNVGRLLRSGGVFFTDSVMQQQSEDWSQRPLPKCETETGPVFTKSAVIPIDMHAAYIVWKKD